MLEVAFHEHPLCGCGSFLLLSGFLRLFMTKWYWVLSNAFSASAEMIMFSPFILLMWCVTVIDFLTLGHPCIPGRNPSCERSFEFAVGLDSLIFCGEFLYLDLQGILVCNFSPLVISLSRFSIRVFVASQKELGIVLSFSMFWKSSRRSGVNSSSSVWENPPVKPSGPGLFFAGRDVMTDSVSTCYRFEIFPFFLESGQVKNFLNRKNKLLPHVISIKQSENIWKKPQLKWLQITNQNSKECVDKK